MISLEFTHTQYKNSKNRGRIQIYRGSYFISVMYYTTLYVSKTLSSKILEIQKIIIISVTHNKTKYLFKYEILCIKIKYSIINEFNQS